MADIPRRFKVLQRFKAKRVDANLPLGQTVIAACDREAEIHIEEGEIVSALVEPSHEPGAVATVIRATGQVDYLYRVEAETFWSSVEVMQHSSD
jgi:hypothetical protein